MDRGLPALLAEGHLADALRRSDEGLRVEVRRRYEQVLGRTPSDAEIDGKLPGLRGLVDSGNDTGEVFWALRKELTLSAEALEGGGVDGVIRSLIQEFYKRDAMPEEVTELRRFFPEGVTAERFDTLAAHLHRTPEFAQKQIIRQAYIAALGREPDARSVDWEPLVVEQLRQGKTRAQAQAALMGVIQGSDEGISVGMRAAFQQELGRPLDDAGLAEFRAQLAARGVSGERMVAEFRRDLMLSQEKLVKDGPAALVTVLYRDVLGRDPDPAGLEHWTGFARGLQGQGRDSGAIHGALAELFRQSEEHQEILRARAPAPAPAPAAIEGPGATNAQKLRWAMDLAVQMGLVITSTTGGVHTPGSYHYQGRAVDVSGSPEVMAEYYDLIKTHSSPTELFYDPRGGIKHGVEIGAIGGHGYHVHVAY